MELGCLKELCVVEFMRFATIYWTAVFWSETCQWRVITIPINRKTRLGKKVIFSGLLVIESMLCAGGHLTRFW